MGLGHQHEQIDSSVANGVIGCRCTTGTPFDMGRSMSLPFMKRAQAFFEGLRHVSFDGSRRDAQVLGYFLVGKAIQLR